MCKRAFCSCSLWMKLLAASIPSNNLRIRVRTERETKLTSKRERYARLSLLSWSVLCRLQLKVTVSQKQKSKNKPSKGLCMNHTCLETGGIILVARVYNIELIQLLQLHYIMFRGRYALLIYRHCIQVNASSTNCSRFMAYGNLDNYGSMLSSCN